jgi:hypothetical protein
MFDKKKAAKKALSDLAVAYLERATKSLKESPTISVITDIEKALGITRFISDIGDGE